MTGGRCDVVVVGGGIVGLATAYALLRSEPGLDLVLVEKEQQVGAHQSGHNSGVVHSGIAYPHGSLKSRLTVRGAAATLALCAEEQLPVRHTGKVFVATRPPDEARLRELENRAREVGITARWWDRAQLRRAEPAVAGGPALFLPDVAAVDYRAVAEALARRVVALGGAVMTGMPVVGVREGSREVTVSAAGPAGETVWRVGHLVACAGLQSDRLARIAGLDPAVRIVPFRGEYYQLPPRRANLVSAMVYPVPDPALPFLGVHLTPMVDGSTTVGPNAVLGLAREGYPRGSVVGRDVRDVLGFPGFWRIARRHWRLSAHEMTGSVSRRAYLRTARTLCPGLRLDDLQPALAGIRAQAVRPDGSFVNDFLIESTARMTHVLNAPSPAATAALPIGEFIAASVLERHSSP